MKSVFRWPPPGNQTVVPIQVEYEDDTVTLTREGEPPRQYTMGATTLIGSRDIEAETRREIFEELQKTIAAANSVL